MRKAVLIHTICAATFLVGCFPAGVPDPTSTPMPSATPFVATTPTEETTSSTLVELTPTMPQAPTNHQESRPEQKCWRIDSEPPADSQLEGHIVFSGEGWLEPSYLLDLAHRRSANLAESGSAVSNLHVSPNRQWLAYRRSDSGSGTSSLEIAGSDGNRVQSIKWDDSWRQISGWLDDERLWISRARGRDDHDSLVVLNPFSGQHQELYVDYPKRLDISPGPGWGWFNWSATIFDPTLHLVIYPGGFDKIRLWDVETNHEVEVVTGTISLNVTPTWSPDSQQFLVTKSVTKATQQQNNLEEDHEELYSVNRRGEVVRLTYLTELYSTVEIGDYAWSPDGRYVAFRLDIEPESYPDLYGPLDSGVARLAILDMFTRKVTNYCIPNRTMAAPVWAPDARQVVIENNSQEIYSNSVYLVDLDRHFVAQIGEDLSAIGWMK